MKLIISDIAQGDLEDILHHTLVAFGQKQAEHYLLILEKGKQAITVSPLIGHKRNDIPPDSLAYFVGKHLLIYEVTAEQVDIVRILHIRMDFKNRIS